MRVPTTSDNTARAPVIMSDLPAGGHIVYNSEKELINDFKKCMRDSNSLETATNYLYQSLLDEMILGQVFEVHFAVSTGTAIAMDGEPEETKPFKIVDQNDIDIFGASNAKIAMDCTCPKCERAVAAARFAPHLEKCMGMGRNSSRIASRRIASSREGGSYFGTALSDDEDDTDWSAEKRKKKIQPVRTNGTKKNGKTS